MPRSLRYFKTFQVFNMQFLYRRNESRQRSGVYFVCNREKGVSAVAYTPGQVFWLPDINNLYFDKSLFLM